MTTSKRKNRFGGSAGGGGYDYQAEACALVGARILSEESLNWVESGCDLVPISFRVETGQAGDDLCIIFRQNTCIEVQTKRGLQRGDDLWEALMALALAIQENTNVYGVLLTTSDASNTITEHLKGGIIKIGQGIQHELPEIAQDFLSRLEDIHVDEQFVCSRLRIIVRDFSTGTSGEDETLVSLRRVIEDPQLAVAARNTLVSDAHDLIKIRGGRDAGSLARIIEQAGIALSRTATNISVIRESFIAWYLKSNSNFSVPGLNVSLPIEEAWVRLRTMSPSSDSASRGETKPLDEQIRDYHEWHRLADTWSSSDTMEVENAARRWHLLVVVGGPGAGKSTLQRRLAHTWSSQGKVVMRVSLKALALRVSRGETLDEAILAVASDGFSESEKVVRNLLRGATCLLADGLDETDPNRSDMAFRLQQWALAHPERRVVLTTRPVGHNPAWFPGWEHVELLPLSSLDVRGFVGTICNLLYTNDSVEAVQKAATFLEKLESSHTASVAARNPQLLGFLIALHSNGYDIGGTRFRLFERMIDNIRQHTVPDRTFQWRVDEPIALRTLECLGWQLINKPISLEHSLKHDLGRQLAEDFSTPALQGQQKATEALSFWEERGLIERISARSESTFTFVHLAFQEFAAAIFLASLPEQEFVTWIIANQNVPQFRETLILTGGTGKLELTITTLLKADNLSDPVSTTAVLAADVMAEADAPSASLRDDVVKHLISRLTSPIPMVAYEAGIRLRPLASLGPTVIGPLARNLAKHEQQWTREVGCALGLLAGEEYVDIEALVATLPSVSDTSMKPGRGSGILRESINNGWKRDLLLGGLGYLLRDSTPAYQMEVVKRKYKSSNHSRIVHDALHKMLTTRLTPQEMELVLPDWSRMRVNFDYAQIDKNLRDSERAFLQSVVAASQHLISDDGPPRLESNHTLGRLWQILKVDEMQIPEISQMAEYAQQEAYIEVIRAAIVVAGLTAKQALSEAEQALSEFHTHPNYMYELTKTWYDSKDEDEPNWDRAADIPLNSNLLFDAIHYPNWGVCKFATTLLWNCVEREKVSEGFKDVLVNGSSYALTFVCYIAGELWQEKAGDLLLSRLEQNLTADCAPLIATLGTVGGGCFRARTEAVLRKCLTRLEVNIVTETLKTIQALDLDEPMLREIKVCYHWWIQEGPQDPEASGVIPESASAPLLTYLVRRKVIAFSELKEAAKVRRSDLRNVAIGAICEHLAENDALVASTLDDVKQGELPSGVVDELSQRFGKVCKEHLSGMLSLLTSEHYEVRLAGIRALGDDWAGGEDVEAALRSFFTDERVDIRNEAISALRRLKKLDVPTMTQ